MIDINFKLPKSEGGIKFRSFVSIDFTLQIGDKVMEGFFMADLTFSTIAKNLINFYNKETDSLVLDFVDWGYTPQIIRTNDKYSFMFKHEESSYSVKITETEIDKIAKMLANHLLKSYRGLAQQLV